MFDPRRPADLRKLHDAAKASYRQLEPFRVARLDAIKQFVGDRYGNDGAPDKVPLNLMEQMVKTYTRKLVSRRPRVRCSTLHDALLPYANELRDAINETIEEIGLADTLEEIVINALFGIGIAKIGITATADDVEGFLHDTGEVFVDSIDLADWVHDMSAKRMEAWQFCGNRYELPRDVVLANPLFDERAKRIVHAKQAAALAAFDSAKSHNPHEIEQGTESEDNDLYDMVELWDYWLPASDVIVTCTADCPDIPLAVINREGPEEGPYLLLSYQKVPNNIMPLAPAVSIMPLHEIVNKLGRKMGRQAERQKSITVYSPAAENDAKRVRDANDGEMVPVQDPASIKEMSTGGVAPNTPAVTEMFRSYANQQAGNIDAIAGIQPQSGTVGQDKLLHASASQLISEMQEKTESFVAKVCRAIGYYLFTDPTGVKLLSRQIEGIGQAFTSYWGPDRRVGKFFQYNISVVPYSMRPQTPEEKLSTILGMIDRLAPLAPLMQQQGYTIDFETLLGVVAENTDSPEIRRIIIPADPDLAAAKTASQDGPKMPRSSTREYVRRNESGGQQPVVSPQLVAQAAGQAAVQSPSPQ